MRYFYRLAEGLPVVAVMNAANLQQHRFTATSVAGIAELVVRDVAGDAAGAKEFPALKKLALAVMQMVDGSALGRVIALRLDSRSALPLGNVTLDHAAYLIALHALPRAMVMAGDETVMVKTGDIWWADLRHDAQIMNNSDDDMVVLLADVRIDS